MPRESHRSSSELNKHQDGLPVAPVRKERLPKSKKVLAKEAAKVIHQVDGVDCVTNTDYGKLIESIDTSY